jgi:hypothetical protein
MRRAGASVEIATALPPGPVRTLALTDLRWARAARRAAAGELAGLAPKAVIYSTSTAALFWPRPGAIRFDASAAGNRPGRHGLWQRPLERRRLAEASLLLPQSEGALGELPAGTGYPPAIVVPVPVAPSAAPGRESGCREESAERGAVGGDVRDIAAITYAANPRKKGLDRVLAAWQEARRDGEELVVAGAGAADLLALGYEVGPERGVRVAGLLAPGEYRALRRRARVFVCAPRREDYGIAQLEALVDGCLLVTTPAPGPYVALALARTLDGRLVGEDLATALRIALDDPADAYSARAGEALLPFSHAAVDRLVAEELLPRLLA